MSLIVYYALAFLPVLIIAAILCGKYLKTRTAPPPRRHALDAYPPRYGRARVTPPVSRVTSRPSSPAPMSGRTTDFAQRNNDTDDYLRNQMLIYNSTSSSSSCDTPSSSSYDSGSSSSSDSGGSCGGGGGD
jgi:uncharacterized membrane protein YgcG